MKLLWVKFQGFYPLLFQFHSYSCSIPVPIPFPFQLHFCPNPILVPIPCCCLDIKFILHLCHYAPISWCKSAIILLLGGEDKLTCTHAAIWWCNPQCNCLIPCATALIECFLCSFREWFASLKLHAFWFASVIGNMQFSQYGRWAHPYSGISPTFRQCSDVLRIYPKNKSVPSIDPHRSPGKLGCYKNIEY